MTGSHFIEAMKKSAIEAIRAENPTSIVYGKVISDIPLQVQVNGKLNLDEEFLVLTKNVSDYEVEIDLKFEGKGSILSGQDKEILKELSMESAKIKVKNALKINDEVVLIQMQGGQKYVILDKMERG